MYFLDTSALVKRYVAEKGSTWVNSLLPAGFIVATITYVEVASAFTRRVRGGTLSAGDHAQAINIFEFDMEHSFVLID
jgi:hypothetical protein